MANQQIYFLNESFRNIYLESAALVSCILNIFVGMGIFKYTDRKIEQITNPKYNDSYSEFSIKIIQQLKPIAMFNILANITWVCIIVYVQLKYDSVAEFLFAYYQQPFA